MKKMILLVAVATFSLASCSKDYTCECTYTDSSDGSTSTTSATLNGKKKDVKTACENGSSTAGTQSIKCEVK